MAALAALTLGGTTVLPTVASAAQAPIGLGAADSFAVLAGAGITNTGTTAMWGDAGSHETTSQTGFNTVTVLGTNHHGDAVTQQAKIDLTTAYGEAAGSGPAQEVATELASPTPLEPGVYHNETLGITGQLTLDTLGDPEAVFIFQAESTLITGPGSSVTVLGGGSACNVFWQVGSSATLDTTSHLVGTVLAAESITANTNATIEGRLLASSGAVTLQSNVITRPSCAGTTGGTDGGSTTGGTSGSTDGSDSATAGGSDADDGASGTGGDATATGGTGFGGNAGRTPPTGAGRPDTGTSGSDTATATPARPELPVTGSSGFIAAAGAAAIGLGSICFAISKRAATRYAPLHLQMARRVRRHDLGDQLR